MRRLTILLLTVGLLAAVGAAQQQRNYPPKMPGAEMQTYKTIGDVKLNIWIFKPEGHQASDHRPAIVFFFGGGWRSGTPQQFLHQSQYLASRGMVVFVPDYRVSSRQGVKAKTCVEDAKSAVRWVRTNASRFGVDPNRIAAGGGSAGGHLAAATATLPDFDPPGEDLSISSVPDALVLFNPALVLAETPGRPMPAERIESLRERFGTDPERISPYHHIKKGQPPAIVFHGRADTTVPYATSEAFCEKAKQIGNRCELVGYEGAKHGFFNYGRDGGQAYYDTLRRADEFLESLGWLKGPPTIQAP